MSSTIDTAFVKQFESEVHMAYQRMGSKLRNTIRTKAGIVGESTTFQKIGKGTAGSKSRHGQVPIMNLEHTNVEVTLQDRYAGEYIDRLDELKIQHDERRVAAESVASALGRDTDDIITTAMDATANSNNVSSATTFSTVAVVLGVVEDMGKADVPVGDGNCFFVVPWEAWSDLLDLDEFSDADYVGADQLPLPGLMQAKNWAGFMWFPHSGLPVDGSADTKAFAYHRSAVGHAIGQDFSLDVTWQGKEQAHLCVGSMSHGAKIIDDNGIIEFLYNT